MAKKKKIKETTIEDFYDLRVDKVDELVAALKGEDTTDYGEVSMKISDCTGVEGKGGNKEFNPYRTDFLSRVPVFLKALFVKWWFAGMVYFFINMGLGMYISNADMILLDGIVLGLVVDVLVNPLFRFMETDKREYNDYMMFPFPFKAYWTFFTNILYYVAVAVLVNFVYFFINEFMFTFNGEPLSWALIALVVDMIFIGIKDFVVHLVRKHRREESGDV